MLGGLNGRFLEKANIISAHIVLAKSQSHDLTLLQRRMGDTDFLCGQDCGERGRGRRRVIEMGTGGDIV